jgi:hypothetical protein
VDSYVVSIKARSVVTVHQLRAVLIVPSTEACGALVV